MSRNCSRKKNAAGGLTRALTLILVLLLFAGLFFYIYTRKEGGSRLLPPELTAAMEQAESSASALGEKARSAGAAAASRVEDLLASASAPGGQATAPRPAPVLLPPDLETPLCPAGKSPAAADHQLRRFSGYALCYRESYELAEWSAYCLERSELARNASRSNDFRPDPAIFTGSAELSDYRGSGYDRGHLAPAADFAYSQEAMSETFYMSNMTPQAPAFNRGIWQQLEAQVRSWAADYGRAYVATGPVLDKSAASYASIGGNAVSVPEAFYKVVLLPCYADEADAATPDDCADLTAFAFVIPNEKCSGSFFDYACTVDEVETLTGLDFFYLLDDGTERRVEATMAQTASPVALQAAE